jgi:hypothetical protein
LPAGHGLPEEARERLRANWAGVFHERVLPILLACESDFAALYPSEKGRPSESIARRLGICLLQEMYDLSDPHALDALSFAARWQFALGLEPGESYLSRRSLVDFRSRLVRLDPEMRLLHGLFIPSLPMNRLMPAQCLAASRAHWGIEDDGFWTLDTQWNEDTRAWVRHGRGRVRSPSSGSSPTTSFASCPSQRQSRQAWPRPHRVSTRRGTAETRRRAGFGSMDIQLYRSILYGLLVQQIVVGTPVRKTRQRG